MISIILSNISSLLEIVGLFADRHSEKDENVNLAMGSIRTALNHTQDYLRRVGNLHANNLELADLWNKASVDAMRVDRGLGDMLAMKSSFWTDPELFRQVGRDVDVITLNRVTDEIDRLRIRLH